ncbi:MAG: hypothetical protein DRJ47_08685 [Thermoprotei archaeon]|nr:MAG: hypothetical protein DRJ47_08685 [Thermoprotei archaeon]
MSAREARIQLILEWLEKHPGVASRVEDKLRSLIGVYGNASRRIKEVITDKERLEKALNIAKQLFTEEKAKLVPSTRSHQFFSEVIRRLTEEEARAAKSHVTLSQRVGRLGRALTRAGYRLGWFAFRTIVVGRILLNWMMRPLKQGLGTLVRWEQSVEAAASAMGLLYASGLLTAESQERLEEAIGEVSEAGIAVQGTMQNLQATIALIAAEAIEPLLPYINQLIDALYETWENVKDQVIPALVDFARDVVPAVISILQNVGPAFIAAFVEGVRVAVPIILSLIRALEPLIPIIAKVIGFLMPFAPLMIAVGTAAYMLSPILTGLGSVLQLIAMNSLLASTAGTGLLGTLGGLLGSLAPILPIIAAVAAAIAGIILLIQHWSEVMSFLQSIWEGFMSALEPIMPLLREIGEFFYNIGRIIFELGRIIAAVFLVSLQKLWDFLSPVLMPVLQTLYTIFVKIKEAIEWVANTIWSVLKPVLDWFKGALDAINNVLGGVADFLGGVANALMSLCFKHATPHVVKMTKALKDFNKEIAKTTGETFELGGELRTIRSPPGAAPLRGIEGSSSYSVIYVTFNVERLASDVDKEELIHDASIAVAEAARRRKL